MKYKRKLHPFVNYCIVFKNQTRCWNKYITQSFKSVTHERLILPIGSTLSNHWYLSVSWTKCKIVSKIRNNYEI